MISLHSWLIIHPELFRVEVATLDFQEFTMEERCRGCHSAVGWTATNPSYLACNHCFQVLTRLPRGIGFTVPIHLEGGSLYGSPDVEALILSRLGGRLQEEGVDPFTAELLKHDFMEAFSAIIGGGAGGEADFGLLSVERRLLDGVSGVEVAQCLS